MAQSESDNARVRQSRLVGLLLVLLTLLIYLPVWQHGFVAFDDQNYIVNNRMVKAGLTWNGITWAFTTFHASNWHPLTWVSHMLDSELFGPHAGAHHLMNGLLHALNALLQFVLWLRLTGKSWAAAFMAAAFAWHPLHVESVAWASERKDVLSTSFGLLALLAYTHHALCAKKSPISGWLWLAVFSFVLSLLAKPMLVTLPFVLMLLDFWPLNRVSGFELRVLRKLIIEKIPFLLLAVASCWMTVRAQRAAAIVGLDLLPLDLRVANSLSAYIGYLAKTFWPVNLAALYPAKLHADWLKAAIAGFVLVAISGGVIAQRRQRPWLLVGWFWFVGMLVPVIGLVQVGSQAMADRYTYLPLTGIFLIVAFGTRELAERYRVSGANVGLVSSIVLAGCLVMTSFQLRHWRDSESLFRRAVTVTPENAIAHAGLADALARQGRNEEAITHFETALKLAPALMNAHNDYANLLVTLGRHDEAREHYQTALKLNPRTPLLHCNLGLLFVKLSRYDEAIAEYDAARRLDPGNPRPHCLMGKARELEGRSQEAATHFRDALRLNSNDAESVLAFAQLLAANQDQTVRNGVEAIALAERARTLPDADPVTVLDTLGMAYAEAGRFPEAAEAASAAITLAEAAGSRELMPGLRSRLQLYRSSTPYRAIRLQSSIPPQQ